MLATSPRPFALAAGMLRPQWLAVVAELQAKLPLSQVAASAGSDQKFYFLSFSLSKVIAVAAGIGRCQNIAPLHRQLWCSCVTVSDCNTCNGC